MFCYFQYYFYNAMSNSIVFLTLSLTRNVFWRSLLELIVQIEILFLFRIWLTVLFMATRSIYSFNLCMSLVYDLEKLNTRYSKKWQIKFRKISKIIKSAMASLDLRSDVIPITVFWDNFWEYIKKAERWITKSVLHVRY